jgi:poly(hydroxyalkanoate) granule-associated protein
METTTNGNVMVENLEEKRPNPIFDAAHKTFQAGLGAVALTQSEIESFFGKLVERGEVAEKDGRKMINELMERRKAQAEEVAGEAVDELESSVERALHTMNVPTKSDIDKLDKKVVALTKKVDALIKEE